MAEMLIELGVLLLGDVGAGLAPECRALVGGDLLAVALDGDRPGDVVGPFTDDGLEAVGLEELVGVGLHVQDDVGACHVAGCRCKRVAALAFRRPAPGLGLADATRGHLDAVRDHEGGVEADAELADQRRPILRFGVRETGRDILAEGAGAGAGDGAEIAGELVPAHADAVVADGQQAARLVRHDADGGTVG